MDNGKSYFEAEFLVFSVFAKRVKRWKSNKNKTKKKKKIRLRRRPPPKAVDYQAVSPAILSVSPRKNNVILW